MATGSATQGKLNSPNEPCPQLAAIKVAVNLLQSREWKQVIRAFHGERKSFDSTNQRRHASHLRKRLINHVQRLIANIFNTGLWKSRGNRPLPRLISSDKVLRLFCKNVLSAPWAKER